MTEVSPTAGCGALYKPRETSLQTGLDGIAAHGFRPERYGKPPISDLRIEQAGARTAGIPSNVSIGMRRVDSRRSRGVAQLAERRSPKPKVGGSRPSAPAMISQSGRSLASTQIVITRSLRACRLSRPELATVSVDRASANPFQFFQEVRQEVAKVTWPILEGGLDHHADGADHGGHGVGVLHHGRHHRSPRLSNASFSAVRAKSERHEDMNVSPARAWETVTKRLPKS